MALSPTQVASFTHHGLHSSTTMHPSSVASYHGFSFQPDLSRIPILMSTTTNIARPMPTSCLLDDPFAPIPETMEDLQRAAYFPFAAPEKAKHLSIQGSLISDLWMEEMGRASVVLGTSDVDDSLIFTTTKSSKIASLPSELSEDLADAILTHLSQEKVTLCPTSTNHSMDIKHLLRAA